MSSAVAPTPPRLVQQHSQTSTLWTSRSTTTFSEDYNLTPCNSPIKIYPFSKTQDVTNGNKTSVTHSNNASVYKTTDDSERLDTAQNAGFAGNSTMGGRAKTQPNMQRSNTSASLTNNNNKSIRVQDSATKRLNPYAPGTSPIPEQETPAPTVVTPGPIPSAPPPSTDLPRRRVKTAGTQVEIFSLSL